MEPERLGLVFSPHPIPHHGWPALPCLSSGSISRRDALKLVGVAAETDQELHATRGLFDHAVSHMAADYGLKVGNWVKTSSYHRPYY